METCAICHKTLKVKLPLYGVPSFVYYEDGSRHNNFTYDGKRIDFEFESFWVCNDCLEEVKHG